MPELKPCPFCGGKPQETCYPTLSYIECTVCDTRKSSWGPESTTPDGTPLNGANGQYWCDVLYAKWNSRAPSEQGSGWQDISTAPRDAESLGPDYLKVLEEECWDLRCVEIRAGGDDSDIGWRVIGHWMSQPQERVIGYGNTAVEAIKDAMRPRDYEGNLLDDPEATP